MEIHQPGINEEDVVSSLNGLTGDVILAAGTNISLGTVGNTITINSTVVSPVDGGGTANEITYWVDAKQ